MSTVTAISACTMHRHGVSSCHGEVPSPHAQGYGQVWSYRYPVRPQPYRPRPAGLRSPARDLPDVLDHLPLRPMPGRALSCDCQGLRERLAILHDACDAWEFRALKAEREGDEVAAAWREALHQNALLENENERLKAEGRES
jgi:hypothetical protein